MALLCAPPHSGVHDRGLKHVGTWLRGHLPSFETDGDEATTGNTAARTRRCLNLQGGSRIACRDRRISVGAPTLKAGSSAKRQSASQLLPSSQLGQGFS